MTSYTTSIVTEGLSVVLNAQWPFLIILKVQKFKFKNASLKISISEKLK